MADGINNNIFLVNAPAGSGKTTEIRRRVETHLREKPNDNILCITYTNRAADELAKDIDAKNVFVGTIHSFINHFISSFFSHRDIIDLYWELYKEKIKKRIENAENKENISESNQRFIMEFGKLDEDTIYHSIQKISYNETPYNSLYRGALSHDDLITFTRAVVDKFPVIKRKIADKYQLIFIDEYQDTSADVLHIFFESMKNRDGEMFLLGDKMQQIYKTYDGSFEREFVTMNRSIQLTINYRTTPYIVSILNNIYNDKNYEQTPYNKNRDEEMSFLPEILITESPDRTLSKKKNIYPDALVLYLLNKKRFSSIGAETLYDAVQKMDKYGEGRKYRAVDVLTNFDDTNPDKLFALLFIFTQIDLDYRNGLYGKVLRGIKKNSKILVISKCAIRKHTDKSVVKELLENILNFFEKGEELIGNFLNYLKGTGIVNAEFLAEIIGDEDYTSVLQIPLQEFHNLVIYLQNPYISTQHGVKGESHNTVIFMAANSSSEPVVNMTKFLELWSVAEVCLTEFEMFYYNYKKMIEEIEAVIGMKSSKMKKEDYAIYRKDIYQKASLFAETYLENVYFCNLLQPVIQKYLEKDGVTNAKECLRENLVYGPLSAYKLFYVGCSRARRNLCIIIDRKDIQKFEERIKSKFEQCGFKVIVDET